MKKLLSVFLFSLLTSHFSLSHAKPVDVATARRAAENLLGKPVIDATPKAFTECYLFTGEDGEGFVLLSADDCVFPLLGYSETETFLTEGMPCNLTAWIEGYQREIASVKAIGGMVSGEVTSAWRQMLDKTPKSRTEGSFVSPLLKSRWNQPSPYNLMCPVDSTTEDNHVVTGCMATATAQVMRYWGHPAQGRGSHSYQSQRYGTLSVNYDSSFYDWENMPDALRGWSSQEEKDAVSKLCYEVGVAMDMNYSPSGSGAYEHSGGMLKRFSAELALENHFGYNPAMYTDFKERYTDAEWDTIISNELEAGRPVIYTGSSSSGGHAFVIDGYNIDGLFHVNWGWGGVSNGYFRLDCLAIGQAGQQGYMPFNEMNNAILFVCPLENPNESVSTVTMVSSNPAQGSVRGGGIYPVDHDRVMLYATAADGYRFSHWASGNTANPIFYYPTADYSDTAYFVPLRTDTLGYCQHFAPNFDTIYDMAHCEWGIRIPAERISDGRYLKKVMNFIYTTGDYILRIYQGDRPVNPLYEDTLSLTAYGWRTIDLATPVRLDGSLPLWITFVTEGLNYSAGITPNTGNPDGSWIKHNGVWEMMDTNVMGYYTWSILGVVGDDAGIEDINPDGLSYNVSGLTLSVDNPEGRTVSLYDIQGRQLATYRHSNFTFEFSSPGVYLLQAAGMPAKRIIAY
ncbi:MAG: C10 family peptidase [bacterium]